MIGKLKGRLDESFEDYAIIDVGGVGYKVYCSAKTLSNLAPGEAVTLFIETHVREDHISLFGFATHDEQKTFLTLQSVKGVGTRMALAILSHMTVSQVHLALSSQDKNAFLAVSGVGKKLAERIVIELKDKFVSSIIASDSYSVVNSSSTKNNSIADDAIAALVSLGVGKGDAFTRVNGIMAADPNLTINDVIRLALQR